MIFQGGVWTPVLSSGSGHGALAVLCVMCFSFHAVGWCVIVVFSCHAHKFFFGNLPNKKEHPKSCPRTTKDWTKAGHYLVEECKREKEILKRKECMMI